MKKKLLLLICISHISFVNAASTTATQSVTMVVNAIDAISVTGGPTMTTTVPAAGSSPADVTNTSTSISYTTNTAARKITVGLSSNMPSDTTLTLTILTPTGATVFTPTLSTTASTLCNAMKATNQTGRTLTYTLTASVSAAPVTSATNTATFTIMAGP